MHTCIHTVCDYVCHTYRMEPTRIIDGTEKNVKCKCSTPKHTSIVFSTDTYIGLLIGTVISNTVNWLFIAT